MYTLENFRRHYAAITVSHITTAFINERTVKGQFGMMCKVYITTIRHGPKPGRHEAEAEAFSMLKAEAEAFTHFSFEAEALVTKPKPKPGYLAR